MIPSAPAVFRVRTAAKINLALDILGRRSDGYHELRTVFQSIGLWDEIEVRPGLKLSFSCSAPELETEENLVLNAARVLREEARVSAGARLHLNKRIPWGAGLGGGSGNAAGALVLLNRLWGVRYSRERLRTLAATLGADVPYFLLGDCALAEGIGERLTAWPRKADFYLVLVMPEQRTSTAEVYSMYRHIAVEHRPDFDALRGALEAGEARALAQSLCNTLAPAAAKLCPTIDHMRSDLLQSGALGAEMTGSGSAVYGIFAREVEAARCRGELSLRYPWARLAGTVRQAIRWG